MVNIKKNYISDVPGIPAIHSMPPDIDDKDISILKTTVTPDEIIMGINYEIGRMPTKNKDRAKELVVQNLKKDPKFYSSLHMMGMVDDMIQENVSEEVSKEDKKRQAFKEIFDELIDRDKQLKKRNVDQRVVDAYTETVDRNNRRR